MIFYFEKLRNNDEIDNYIEFGINDKFAIIAGQLTEAKTYLKKILNKKSLLTVLNLLNNQNTNEDLNNYFKKAVFNAIYSSKKKIIHKIGFWLIWFYNLWLKDLNHTNYLDECLKWNQIDTARNFLELNRSNEIFNRLFESALKKNNTNFVKMILDLRINLSQFLTHKTLYSLYEFEKVLKHKI